MKFYDRELELALLKNSTQQSKESSCFTVMIGRRRIGKTSLLLESVKSEKYLYLFVSRKSESLLCEQFVEEAKRSIGLEIYGKVTEFRLLFEQLMKYATKNHYTLIIDEFQEFDNINRSIFSDIQDIYLQINLLLRWVKMNCSKHISNRIMNNTAD